jgi:endoribonuclease Dicer
VPLDGKFQTEDPKVVVGKCCDRGHRWMVSKTIADCVEALIGAYYIGGGLVAALHMMKWLEIDAELDPSLVIEAIAAASLRSYVPKTNEIATLESKLHYEFSAKGLLQEAITHASEQEVGVGYCYQVTTDVLSRLDVINLSVPIPALLKSPLQMAVEEDSLCKFQKLATHKFFILAC